MKTITQDDFNTAASADRYFVGRWPYFSKVCEIINAIVLKGPVLEIGPYKLPLVVGSDRLDVSDKWGVPLTFRLDASKTPWPIEDRHYEAVIALQVWEHLSRKSHPAPFRELRRVAHWAVLSFPYKWNCEKDPTHHAIDDKTIATWTDNQPCLKWLIGSENGNRRMICLFRFGA